MRVAKLREQLATPDPLSQIQRGIPGGIGRTLDLQYLPDRDGKAQHGYSRGGPCQDPKDLWIGRQIGEQIKSPPPRKLRDEYTGCKSTLADTLGSMLREAGSPLRLGLLSRTCSRTAKPEREDD